MRRSILWKLLTAAVAIGLLCTGNAFAAGKAGTFTLSPMVGYHKIDGALD